MIVSSMKTLFKTFAYAAIAALAFSSCVKENLKPADEITGKLVTVHFGTENTDPSTTRATLTPNAWETAFQAAWENEDQIYISYSLDYAKANLTTGTWKGTSFEAELLTEGNGVWIYDAAYPVPADDNSVDFGSSRTQKGNAFNSKYDIMIGSAVAEGADAGKDEKGNDIVFEMTRQTAIAYFHLTSKLDEPLVSATLKVTDGAIANSAASITDKFKFVPQKESDETEIKLTFEKGTAPSAKDFQLWFNVLPTPYSSMSLTVETETKTFTISKASSGEYLAGKLYKVNKVASWTDKPTILFFHESFDKTDGTGGNDNQWNGSIATNDITYDKSGWSVEYANGAYQCLKVGSSKQGTATTPALNITTGDAKLWFKAGAWNGSSEKTTISVSIVGNGEITPSEITLKKAAWSEYDCTISGADADTKVKFSAKQASNNRFFLDEIYVYSGSKPVVLPKLESPKNLICSEKTETSLTFKWDAVANASGYQVILDNGSTYLTKRDATSYIWTGLTAGITKTLYVKAIGDGTSYTDSEAVSATGTTTSSTGEGGETKYYVKVSSITSGHKYLLVDGTHIFDGSNVSKTTPGIDCSELISNDKIESNATVDAYAVTIISDNKKYKVLLSTGNYLVINSSTSSNLTSNTTGESITISSQTDGSFRFISGNRSARGICYRAGATNAFKNYAVSNFGSGEYGGNIVLYELAE